MVVAQPAIAPALRSALWLATLFHAYGIYVRAGMDRSEQVRRDDAPVTAFTCGREWTGDFSLLRKKWGGFAGNCLLHAPRKEIKHSVRRPFANLLIL